MKFERVVGVDKGHADAEAVGGTGQRRHLRDQADDLLVSGLRIEDVLGVEVEGREGGNGGDQHPHRMGVVVEPLEKPLPDVFVDERVVGDLVLPRLVLPGVGQLPVDQEVGDLEVGRLLGQLLDGVAAVVEDPRLAIEIGDGALAHRRRRPALRRRTRGPGAAWSTPPPRRPRSTMGISMLSPLRLSVIVMLSATCARSLRFSRPGRRLIPRVLPRPGVLTLPWALHCSTPGGPARWSCPEARIRSYGPGGPAVDARATNSSGRLIAPARAPRLGRPGISRRTPTWWRGQPRG